MLDGSPETLSMPQPSGVANRLYAEWSLRFFWQKASKGRLAAACVGRSDF
jgi:hypothetical protein